MRLLALLVFASIATCAPLNVVLESNVTELNPSLGVFEVKYSITNTHSQPLVLLQWNSPLDQNDDVFRSDMFYIRHKSENKVPLYIGILVKRAPTPSDFVTLRPGQTIEGTLDLLKGYWFPSLGEYEIFLSTEIFVHDGLISFESISLTDFEPVTLVSAPIPVLLTGLVPPPAFTSASTNNSLGVTYVGCSTTEQSTMSTSDTNANTLIAQVNTYLAKGCASVYVTWMGACDTARFNQVITNYKNIGNRRTSGYRANCNPTGCGSDSVYAYVQPADTQFNVYFCKAFWNSASVSTCVWDSKPGTIIHELSHFNSVAATGDYAYGTSACQNLARTDPKRATQNADNHEYLGEACPK